MMRPPYFHVLALEARSPGWRVIAGPFHVNAPQKKLRAAERRSAAMAKLEQASAGVPVKLVIYRGDAYVLRNPAGWQEQANNGETRVFGSGLVCEICGRDGIKSAQGMVIHKRSCRGGDKKKEAKS